VSILWRGRLIEAVLLDLDGTLLDTAADIALALNRATAERGLRALDEESVRRMVGRGAPVLIERATAALGGPLDAGAREELLQRFFHHYGELEARGEFSAAPYPGAREALQALHAAHLRTALVTNKQQRFAASLMDLLGLAPFIDVVVGGDRCERRKPDPQPLLYACDHLQVAAERALMVGDSINDVEAARGAGMPVVCVSYGYNEGQDPRSLPCDALIDSLADLLPLLHLEPGGAA
jgi:phosphoglycolate phosphatase